MATISKNGANGNHKFTLTTTEGAIDIANNTSPVSFTFEISSNGGAYDWYYWGSDISFIVTINGTKYTGTIPDYDGTSTVTLKSGTLNVPHNADGSKLISISFSVVDNAGQYYTCGNASASGTMTLTTIPRASSFGDISGSTIGSSMIVDINRNSSSFTHSLWYSFGNKTWQGIGSGLGTAVSFTLPESLCSEIPNATSGTLTLILRTYNGSTQIGSDVYKTLTVSIPKTLAPSIPTISVSEAESGLASKFGGYVKGKSKLSVSLSASGVYGSSITSYSTSILGSNYNGSSFTSGILTSNGTVKIKTTVTDSRGRTSSNEISITVIDYSNPYISLFNVERCNSDGTLNDDGVYIKATFTCGISSVNSKNDKTIKIQYQNGSSWVDLVTYSEYSKSNATYISTVTFTTDSSFNFRLYVADYFINVTSPDNIGTGFTLININKDVDMIAFGKVVEDVPFDVGLEAKFRKKTMVENELWYNNKMVHASSAGSSSNAYMKIATITVVGTYANRPILIKLSRRGNVLPTNVSISFANENSADPNITKLVTDNVKVYISKSSAGKWDLYVGSYAWEKVLIHDISFDGVSFLIEYHEFVTLASLPSGYIEASNLAVDPHTHVMTDISDWGGYIYSAKTSRPANTVLAAPNGSAGAASFRTLVATDLPSHSHNYLIAGYFQKSVSFSNGYAKVSASGVTTSHRVIAFRNATTSSDTSGEYSCVAAGECFTNGYVQLYLNDTTSRTITVTCIWF